jgi:tetratricopeptide (TPR) repeat protein
LKSIDGTTPVIYWALLGESLSKTGNNQRALTVFKDWVDKRPEYRAAWLSTANTQEKLMDFKGALDTISSALLQSPKDTQFNVLLAYFQILNQQYSNAQIQLNTLTKEQMELPLIQGLQAQIFLTKKKYREALPGLTTLYTVQASPRNAALVFATMLKLEQSKEAIDFMKTHIENNMGDRINRNTYAEYSININLEEAKKHYYVLLAEQPDAIVYLNNLAFVEYKLKNYEKANKLASHAMAIDKRQPQVLDTLALIKEKLGEKEVAIKLLKEAMLLAPNDMSIANHYKEISSL